MGQHGERHPLDQKQRQTGKKRDHYPTQKQATIKFAANQRNQGVPEKFAQPGGLPVFALMHTFQGFQAGFEAQHQPGGQSEGREQGEKHGHGTQYGNGGHVRTHHPAHKTHGQQGGNDRKSRQNGGITHFAYGINEGFGGRCPFLQPAAIHVLDNHDGIVDENTDGENQSEQTDPIDGDSQ